MLYHMHPLPHMQTLTIYNAHKNSLGVPPTWLQRQVNFLPSDRIEDGLGVGRDA